MNVREGNKIYMKEENKLLVFPSINQAKRYNRTKLNGAALVGDIKANSETVSEQLTCKR